MSEKDNHNNNNNQHMEDAEQLATGLSKQSIETIETAGALLRYYRLERQVSLPELAAVLKVTPDKLDALENDRYDTLPDMVFTRALSISICRLLAVDSAEVLAKLPSIHSPMLLRDSDGLNRPFKGGAQPAIGSGRAKDGSAAPKALLLVAGLLLAAALVYFWPHIQSIISPEQDANASMQVGADANGSGIGIGHASGNGSAGLQSLQVPGLLALQESGSGANGETTPTEPFSAQLPLESADEGTGETVVSNSVGSLAAADTADTAATVGAEQAAAANGVGSPAVVTDTLRIIAQEPVWVQVRDGANAIVHQSTLPKGRELSIANNPPLRVEIGRADAVQVMVKGQEFDVSPYSRRNVARFEVTP